LPTDQTHTEFADVTEQLLDKHSLATILSDPLILPYFRSLSVSTSPLYPAPYLTSPLQQITDQPRDRPFLPIPAAERQKHIIVSLTAPPPSRAADTVPFISALFGFIDSLQKVSLRPETRTKLKRTREDVDKLIKEDSEKDKKDEVCVFLPTYYYLDWWNWFVSVAWQLAAEKLAAKKRAEEERISKLSAAEQKKVGGSSQIEIPPN
jgi:Protein of unknown function (DUF1682)